MRVELENGYKPGLEEGGSESQRTLLNESLAASIFLGQVALDGLDVLRQDSLLSDAQRRRVDVIVNANKAVFLLHHFRAQNALSEKDEKRPNAGRLDDIRERQECMAAEVERIQNQTDPKVRDAEVDELINVQLEFVKSAQQSFDEMVEANLGLCREVANRFHLGEKFFDDVEAAGRMGLMIALVRFDPRLGYKFSTSAYPWIYQKAYEGLKEFSQHIKLPDGVNAKISKLRRVEASLTQQLGRPPTFMEIAEEVGMPVDPRLQWVHSILEPSSL